MENRRLKKPVVYLMYSLGFVLLVSIAYLIEGALSPKKLDDNPLYVSNTIFDDIVPVVATDTKIIRPYTDTEVKILRNYYDYKGEEKDQEQSIIVYDKTYLQSSGITYGGKDTFDVVSILDGTVLSVKEDELLGNVVEIRHDNDIISVYQSLGDVNVKINDSVKQGQVIGKSGTSNLNKDLGSNLYFELIIKGVIVNPDAYYDKNINEL